MTIEKIELKEGAKPMRVEQEEAEEGRKKKKGKLNVFQKKFKPGRFKGKAKKVAVIYLRNDGNAEAMELATKKGFFNIDGRTYHIRRDCVYTMTKDRIPLAIIPEWSLVPIGTYEFEHQPMQIKFAEFQDHTLQAIRHAELVRGGGSGIGKLDKKVVIIGLICLIAGAILMNYL